MMNNEDLKPCPLCGTPPKLEDLAGWEISCDGCGLNLCLSTPDQEPLVATWNHRVAPPVAEAIPAHRRYIGDGQYEIVDAIPAQEIPAQTGAGASIDTPEYVTLKDALIQTGVNSSLSGHVNDVAAHLAADDAFAAYINAYGQQKYQSGRVAAHRSAQSMADGLRERAEKAEAYIKELQKIDFAKHKTIIEKQVYIDKMISQQATYKDNEIKDLPKESASQVAAYEGEDFELPSLPVIECVNPEKDTIVKAMLASTKQTGHRAKKIGGSYQAAGTVVSDFHTLAGERRVVFEFDEPKGMLHIFSPQQISFEGE